MAQLSEAHERKTAALKKQRLDDISGRRARLRPRWARSRRPSTR